MEFYLCGNKLCDKYAAPPELSLQINKIPNQIFIRTIKYQILNEVVSLHYQH